MIIKIVNQCAHTFSSIQSGSIDPKYRPDIDGLRAIAVISVVIFHAFPEYFPGGFVGVDVFFVISGYLISSIICNEFNTNSFSFAQFYSRRIKRIFPSLITVLATCYAIGWYFLLPIEFKSLGAHIAAGAGFFSNLLLSEESGYFDLASDTKPLLHLWSLGIEEQFYIIWPVFLYMSRKKTLNLLALTSMLILSSFTLNIITVKINKNQNFYWPTSRIWELLIGAQLTFVSKYIDNHSQNVITRKRSSVNISTVSKVLTDNSHILHIVTSTVGILLVTLPMYFLTKASVFPGWWALAPTLGTACLISTGPTAWINKNILSSRPLVGIGLISYPLYLWHWPLLVFMRMYIGDTTSVSAHILVMILSVVIAWITYVFIEKPFRFGLFTKAKFAFLCISMVIIGIIGYHTYRSNGLSYRLPPSIRNITYYNNTYMESFNTAYGGETCFLASRLGRTKFDACVHNMEKSASTAVVLCGDSHAAHLLPGIIAAKPDFRITYLTAAECAPIYGTSRADIPACEQIMNYIFNRISYEKPNTVVLAANWGMYPWKNLTGTVEYLRNATVKNIYLVGPVPYWPNGLPRSLYTYYLRDPLHQIPTRMRFGLDPYVEYPDRIIEAFAKNLMIHYISPYQILCNSNGCLTKTEETIDTLISFDWNHLTIHGSTFLVAHFPKNLLHAAH